MKLNEETNSMMGARSWLARKLAAVALGIGASFSLGTSAALLGVEPGFPLISYTAGAQGQQTSYTASTGSFTVSGVRPEGIQFTDGATALFINFPKSVDISIVVDNSGNLVGGVAGDDLVVTGTILGGGPANPTGVLLTGEIVAFGFQDTGGPGGKSTDFFDFRFVVTGGDLAALPEYAGQEIGVELVAENSFFAGSFAVNFVAGAKGNIGPVPPGPTASLGDRVWLDENQNGDQDCSNTGGLDESNQIPGDGGSTCAEPPVPNVPVQLTDCSGNVLATDTTDADGFYLFTGLDQGAEYCVQFEAPDNCEWTAPNSGASDLTDSDVDGTGFVNTGILNVAIDRSWDAGLVCQEPPASLGDRVWLDEDEDGDQDCSNTAGLDESNQIPGDGGSTCAEPPVPDVPVQLTDCAGNVLQSDVTDANGFYLFMGLVQGENYCVQFETPDNCEWTARNSGASDLTDSDVDSTGFVDTGILDVEVDRSWDAGLVCQTASLGDRVWNDLDADGDQDCVNTGGLDASNQIPGDGGSFCNEPPEPGVVVELTNCDTGDVLGTDITDAGGFYLFTGLDFTTDYCLQFTKPDNCEWTFQDSGDSDLTDSDVDTSGFANVGMLVAEIDRSWDAGLLCGGPDIDIEKSTNTVDADDPNAGDAPQVMPGDTVTWAYVITNTGGEPLTNIVVADDQGVMLTCANQPATLFPGQSFTCTASGPAEDLNTTGFTTVPGLCGSVPNTPLYENFGLVSGTGTVTGGFVEDNDPSHYCNPQEPMIKIEKATNGVDADDPNAGDAPQIAEGGLVTWTYVITNVGNEPVTNIDVLDDQGVALTCRSGAGIPAVLDPGDSFTCTASGPAEDLNNTGFTTVPGLCGSVPNTPLYENMGKVTGSGLNSGEFVQDDDPSHYCNPQEPEIDIEKATNGIDADNPNAGDAPQVMPGGPVNWTYVVTNVGNEPLINVSVTDDQGVAVACPKTALAPGESMICTASGTAEDLNFTSFTTVPGLCGGFPATPLYENMGKAVGTGANSGAFVDDEDPSHYCNPQQPAIDIEKLTNGVDADDPNAGDAPQIMPGDPVTWTYLVTNVGNTTLVNVAVDDDQIGPINCPKTTLIPMESMICSKSGVAEDLLTTGFVTVPGLCGGFPQTPLYENMGRATGETSQGGFVEDDDPSHYCNPQAPGIKIEKLTNGFDADSRDESSTSVPGPATVPTIMIGDTVTWTYKVTNTGNTVLNPVTVSDDAGTPGNTGDDFCTPNAGPCAVTINCPLTALNPGQKMDCSAQLPAADLTVFTPVVAGQCSGRPTDLYENGAVAVGEPPFGADVTDDDPSHYCNPGICELDVNKTCLVIPPPQPPAGDGSCQKPIDVLKLQYAGSKTITNVTWYAGEVGQADAIRSATAAEIDALNAGQVVNFNGFEANNSPNDVEIVTTFADGSSTTSQFHLSCSDPEMNGPEDCGSVIGNGKSNNLPASSNIWTFRGTLTPTGEGIFCPLPPASPVFPTQTACEFTPPQSAASCSDIKNLTALTMIWNGPDGVNVVSELGEVFNGVNNGDVITFGVDGDTDLTISGPVSGISTFHVSCSDDDMNGPEDCGKPQGNAKNNDDPDFINDWRFEGMTGEKGVIDCAVVEGRSGAEVTYGIEVANLNSESVTVMISDPLLGIAQTETIAGNDTFRLQTDPTLIVPDGTDVFTNVVSVSGQTASGASCDASASSSLTRNPPPPPPVSCSDIKDITELAMVWNGPSGVDITTATGQFFPNVQSGNQITFDTVGVGNDVVLTLSGAVTGTSEFHISCSDEAMNGSEDCGSAQGNGKSNVAGLINDFLFDGMIGENGSFQCGLPNTGVVDPETPPAGADVTAAPTLEVSDDKIKWALTNNGNQTVYVTEVVVTWPAQHVELKTIKMDGDFAKDIKDTTSPTNVPTEHPFTGGLDKRRLKAGDTKNLEFQFKEKVPGNSQGDYTISITFDNGQTLTFP